jgi:hypothetical protein
VALAVEDRDNDAYKLQRNNPPSIGQVARYDSKKPPIRPALRHDAPYQSSRANPSPDDPEQSKCFIDMEREVEVAETAEEAERAFKKLAKEKQKPK